MHSTYFRNKLDIRWEKVVLLLLLLVLLGLPKGRAQINQDIHLPNFDNQKIHYGFLIGGHWSNFNLQYSDLLTDQDDLILDTLHSIVPEPAFGFRLGFIANYHIYDVLDVRAGITFSFNQLQLNYRLTDGETVIEELIDPTYVELPILVKYKSIRRRNRRMYGLVGLTPALKASGTKDEQDTEEKLLTKNFNLSLEIGAGFDSYEPFFKFSPEIRYSFGLLDVLDDKPNDFSVGIKRLSIHTISFYITFEGGPSELKRTKKKR